MYLCRFSLFLLSCLLLPSEIRSHSQMSYPQSTSPTTCRMGGDPRFGVGTCAGPCDLRAVKNHFSTYDSPSAPAATFRRGELVPVRYQRNNHGPGGFIRYTLVSPAQIMDKAKHEKNAFAWGCWGANAVQATAKQRLTEKFGFSLVGNDGDLHHFPVAFYESTVRIPRCVPDGDYVLGWVWFGGVGGGVKGNGRQKPPSTFGYFGDYWSCSFVRIQGGGEVSDSAERVFDNEMRQWSPNGCMSANDKPGVCTYEPCKATASYQKPREFKAGKPGVVRAEDYGGPAWKSKSSDRTSPSTSTVVNGKSGGSTSGPKRVKSGNGKSTDMCWCLVKGKGCRKRLAKSTGGVCKQGIERNRQSWGCRKGCCDYCRGRKKMGVCKKGQIRELCRL